MPCFVRNSGFEEERPLGSAMLGHFLSLKFCLFRKLSNDFAETPLTGIGLR